MVRAVRRTTRKGQLFREDAALLAFHLTRHAFGLERLGDEVLGKFFRPGRAVLSGAWNALEVKEATARTEPADWHLEQRVTYGFGPLAESTVQGAPADLWGALCGDRKRPLMAYAEIRFSELLMASDDAS